MPEMQHRGAGPFSSASHDSAGDDKDPHGPSSIPPWVHANKSEDEESDKLLTPPSQIRPNTRHYKPPPPHNYKLGRKWDHLRDAEPPFLSTSMADAQARWKPVMASSPNPNTTTMRQQGRIVDAAWMAENMPDMLPDWQPDDGNEAEKADRGTKGFMYRGKWLISPERQERTVRLFWRLLLKNPFVPLFFRVTVLTFSTGALGLAVSIYSAVQKVNADADADNPCASRASTFMAIGLGSVALPYIGYVTWDEYLSKP